MLSTIQMQSILSQPWIENALGCQLGIVPLGKWEGFVKLVDECLQGKVWTITGAGWIWYWREDGEKGYTSWVVTEGGEDD
ncbi:hypothetical protein Tco_0412230 [Tanacetum coccineum]